jgi:hypothetical protein
MDPVLVDTAERLAIAENVMATLHTKNGFKVDLTAQRMALRALVGLAHTAAFNANEKFRLLDLYFPAADVALLVGGRNVAGNKDRSRTLTAEKRTHLQSLGDCLDLRLTGVLKTLASPVELSQALLLHMQRLLQVDEVAQFAEKFAATIGAWRNQGALMTYMTKLSAQSSTAKAMIMLRQFVRKVLECRFLEERYHPEIPNLHLKALAEHPKFEYRLWETANTSSPLLRYATMQELVQVAGTATLLQPTPFEFLRRVVVEMHHLDGRLFPRSFSFLLEPTTNPKVPSTPELEAKKLAEPPVVGLSRSVSVPVESRGSQRVVSAANAFADDLVRPLHLPRIIAYITNKRLTLEDVDFTTLLDKSILRLARAASLQDALPIMKETLALVFFIF